MHTLSPAAMAAIRTLMAELDAAAVATKRSVSVTLSADFAGNDGNYAVNVVDIEGAVLAAGVLSDEDHTAQGGYVYGTGVDGFTYCHPVAS
jgi:hypothetical protein